MRAVRSVSQSGGRSADGTTVADEPRASQRASERGSISTAGGRSVGRSEGGRAEMRSGTGGRGGVRGSLASRQRLSSSPPTSTIYSGRRRRRRRRRCRQRLLCQQFNNQQWERPVTSTMISTVKRLRSPVYIRSRLRRTAPQRNISTSGHRRRWEQTPACVRACVGSTPPPRTSARPYTAGRRAYAAAIPPRPNGAKSLIRVRVALYSTVLLSNRRPCVPDPMGTFLSGAGRAKYHRHS